MGAVKSVVFGSLETISASKAQQQTGFVEGNWSSKLGERAEVYAKVRTKVQ